MDELRDELAKLRALYDAKVATGEADRAAKAEHKQQEQVALKALERARLEEARPAGLGYTFTAVRDQEKGRVTDRRAYFQWALEQEPSLEDFVEGHCTPHGPDGDTDFRADLYEALHNLSILHLAESQRTLNATVKRCHDDEQPLPPGVDFEPVPYVSVTKA